MLLTPKDFSEPFDSTSKPGKYYFEQKGMHWAATVVFSQSSSPVY